MAFKLKTLCLIIIIRIIYVRAENNNYQKLTKSTNDKPNEETCVENKPFVWCIPKVYSNRKEPWRYRNITNSSLPWIYHFKFDIRDVQQVNDKKQTVRASMHLEISWLEPRLIINSNAPDWNDTMFGSPNEVNISPEILKQLWNPDLLIYGMESLESKNVLKEMSVMRINKTRFIKYDTQADVTFSCQMNFGRYPLDSHECPFLIGSYYSTDETFKCTSEYTFDYKRQRSLQYFIDIKPLPERDHIITWKSKNYSICGFNIALNRSRTQTFFQVYLTTALFVIVSWISFIIKADVIPGRMGVLVTIFLVLINIFNGVKSNAPASATLNAVDLYIVICIAQVFLALAEYAIVLFQNNYSENSISPLRAATINVSLSTQNNFMGTAPVCDGRQPLRHKLDSVSLCIFPIAFITFNIIYIIVYN